MRLRNVLPLLALPLLVATLQAKADEARSGKCTPSFVEVSPTEPIRAEAGSWKIFFKVALVGCAEKLKTLNEDELRSLREEFRNPTEWSNLLLVNKETSEKIREKAVHRVTAVLGRKAVTDILFHDIAIVDHNVQ